jgi:hypothetical protein
MTAIVARWVYAFTDGDPQRRDLLGGKGTGLADMAQAGLPVPPGFTITTEACTAYYQQGEALPDGLWDEVLAAPYSRWSRRAASALATWRIPCCSLCAQARSSLCRG